MAGSHSDQVPYLGGAGPRERLARRATGKQINAFDTPIVELSNEIRGIGEVPGPGEAPDVRGMGLDGNGVGIRGGDHGEPLILKTQAQPPRAAEEVDRPGVWASPQPLPDGVPVIPVGGVPVWLENYPGATMERDHVVRIVPGGFLWIVHGRS